MRRSYSLIFLLGISSAAVGAQTSIEASPMGLASNRTGSRAERPVNSKSPQNSSTAPSSSSGMFAISLNAEHLATIQGVGRTVLAAKHSVQPDPAVETMRQQLNAVSSELIQVFRDGSMSKPILHLANKNNSSTISPQSASPSVGSTTLNVDIPPVRRLVPSPDTGVYVEETLAPLLNSTSATQSVPVSEKQPAQVPTKDTEAWHRDVASLQARLVNVRIQVPVIPDTSDARTPVHRHLATKEAQLLDEVQRAVDAQDVKQLAALRERLLPRRLPAERERLRVLASSEPGTEPVPTPTMSTLTKHR